MSNQSIEIYSYEANDEVTEMIISSYNNNDSITLRQQDLKNIKILLKKGILYFEGYLNSENHSEIFKLNKWSRISGENSDFLRKIELKIIRGNFVVRHYIFNAFMIDYSETFIKNKYEFILLLRISTVGTGFVPNECSVQKVNINDVPCSMIIEPQEQNFDITKNLINTTLSASTGITGYTLLKGIAVSNPITLKIFLLIHGTGMVSEFLADVYFVAKGEPEKMGSFNITRDYFYKPLGESLANLFNKVFISLNIPKNIGEDFYNTGMITLSITQLGQSGMQHINKTLNNGTNLYFSFRIKPTQFSHYGFKVEVVEKSKSPILNLTKSITKDLGFDAYSTGMSIKNEYKKRRKGGHYE